MYQISPIQTKQGIDLPSCMYKIQPVNMTLHSDNQDSSGKSVTKNGKIYLFAKCHQNFLFRINLILSCWRRSRIAY